jgi:hypothetical protein
LAGVSNKYNNVIFKPESYKLFAYIGTYNGKTWTFGEKSIITESLFNTDHKYPIFDISDTSKIVSFTDMDGNVLIYDTNGFQYVAPTEDLNIVYAYELKWGEGALNALAASNNNVAIGAVYVFSDNDANPLDREGNVVGYEEKNIPLMDMENVKTINYITIHNIDFEQHSVKVNSVVEDIYYYTKAINAVTAGGHTINTGDFVLRNNEALKLIKGITYDNVIEVWPYSNQEFNDFYKLYVFEQRLKELSEYEKVEYDKLCEKYGSLDELSIKLTNEELAWNSFLESVKNGGYGSLFVEEQQQENEDNDIKNYFEIDSEYQQAEFIFIYKLGNKDEQVAHTVREIVLSLVAKNITSSDARPIIRLEKSLRDDADYLSADYMSVIIKELQITNINGMYLNNDLVNTNLNVSGGYKDNSIDYAWDWSNEYTFTSFNTYYWPLIFALVDNKFTQIRDCVESNLRVDNNLNFDIVDISKYHEE